MSSRAGDKPPIQPNLVLVGFMGTGKSAVGRALAARLGRPLVDTDLRLAHRAGLSIPEIFRAHGEERFRELETEEARRVSRPAGLVVSTGGGILGRDENVELLRRGGVLIRLTSRPEVILRRTAPWDNRPMLATAADPRAAVERLLAVREARYALADWTLDTSDLSVDQVVEEICAALPSLYRAAATRF
ncbi:MAG: shikimate kinase [Armatimonadota bacterium]